MQGVRRCVCGLAVMGLIVGVGSAGAQVTTERSASILVFPKVIATGTRDTIIQITNTSNSMVHAHCIYVNGGRTDLSQPADPLLNPPLCTKLDFDIWLTKQQPTVWVVSTGRRDDPTDPSDPCRVDPDCIGSGFDIGPVPPVGGAADNEFTGELKCIEVDASGLPIPGNHLKGEATLVTLATGDVSKYNALGIVGDPDNLGIADEDGALCLGAGTEEPCPAEPEYDACPAVWILNHFAEGAKDPVAQQLDDGVAVDSSVSTEVTFVPCTEDFENLVPTSVVVQFLAWNEFESRLSASTLVTCWANPTLSEISTIFGRASQSTDFVQTRMTSTSASGLLIVGEEFHNVTFSPVGVPPTDLESAAAMNAHVEGQRTVQDVITLSPDEIRGGPGLPEPEL